MEKARLAGHAARAARPILLTVLLLLPPRAATEAVRVMESRAGRVSITVVPIGPAQERVAEPDAQAGALPAPPAPGGSAAQSSPSRFPDADDAGTASPGMPIDSIVDFTSLPGINRNGEALLHIEFYDKGDSRELRFPLRYSELRRFLLRHPLDYRSGTAEERMVGLVADLARSLRVEMKDASQAGGKP